MTSPLLIVYIPIVDKELFICVNKVFAPIERAVVLFVEMFWLKVYC